MVEPGNGLRGMRERLSACGGRVEVRTSPGEGFELGLQGRLHERVLTVADLHAADDVAVLNSLRGRRPAVLWATSPVGGG